MTKLDKIEREAQKAREKIAAMQLRLKEIDGQRTEQENLQIVQQIRALRLNRDELYGFINEGKLPAAFAAIAQTEPEVIYSRKGKIQEPEETEETITNYES